MAGGVEYHVRAGATGELLHERQGVAGAAGELVGGAVGEGNLQAAGQRVDRDHLLRAHHPRILAQELAERAEADDRHRGAHGELGAAYPGLGNGGELGPCRRLVGDRVGNPYRRAARHGDLVVVRGGEHPLAGGEAGHGGPDLLDHADVAVAEVEGVLHPVVPVRPWIGLATVADGFGTGADQADARAHRHAVRRQLGNRLVPQLHLLLAGQHDIGRLHPRSSCAVPAHMAGAVGVAIVAERSLSRRPVNSTRV